MLQTWTAASLVKVLVTGLPQWQLQCWMAILHRTQAQMLPRYCSMANL
jgi:hypothetical protein